MDERKNELLPIWHELVTGLPDAQEQCLMPNFIDACELPTVADMLVDDHVHIPVTEERFLAKLDSILSDVAEFRRKVKIDLVKLLMPATHPLVTTDSTVDDVEQDVDFTILDNVSSLFRCPAWNCRTLIGFPAIFAHEHVKEYNTRWPILRDRMRPDKDVGPTVLEVLKILGIHDGTPVAALEDLDGRFVCMCGHPKFQAPMTFGSLVRSICNLFYNLFS
jgi:hypothetical protein